MSENTISSLQHLAEAIFEDAAPSYDHGSPTGHHSLYATHKAHCSDDFFHGSPEDFFCGACQLKFEATFHTHRDWKSPRAGCPACQLRGDGS